MEVRERLEKHATSMKVSMNEPLGMYVVDCNDELRRQCPSDIKLK